MINAALIIETGEWLGIISAGAMNRRFRFDPYLRLFEEPEEARP